MRNRPIFTVALFLTLTVTPSFGQVFEKGDRKLEIEFVQLPPCPIGIRTTSVTLDTDPAADKEQIMLRIENRSEAGIRAYAMVSGGNRYPTVHTWVFPTVPFEPGKPVDRAVWPNRQEHYYFFFDYILYSDGTVCGLNNHRRSLQIESYLKARESAISRLKELADDAGEAQLIEHLDRLAAPGFFSADKAGPPNPDTIDRMPQRAWEHVVMMLRRLKTDRSASDLANKLEAEIPGGTNRKVK